MKQPPDEGNQCYLGYQATGRKGENQTTARKLMGIVGIDWRF